MAAIKFIKRTVALDGGSVSDPSPNAFFDGEQGAHTFIIAARRGGQPLMLSGAVSATFLNQNDAVVLVTGSIVDGAAVVTLSNPCYELSGRFTLTIDVAGATVYECQSRIKRRSSGTAYDPSGEISVAALSAEIAEMRTATAAANTAAATANTAAAAANTARENIQTDLTTYVVHSEPYVASIANYPDLNDLPVNSFMQFTTFNGVQNAPVANPGYILSLSAKEGKAYGVAQILLDSRNGWLYTRFKWGAQAYTDWYALARNVEMYEIAEKIDSFLSPYVEGFKNKLQDKYLLPNGNGLGNAANYAVTPFLETKPGDCWVYEGRQNGGGLPNIVAYSDNNFSDPQILSFGAVNGRVIVFIPSGAKYVVASAMTYYPNQQPKFYHEHNVIYYDTNQSQSLRAYIGSHITNAGIDNRYTVRLFAGEYDMGADFTSAELADDTFIGYKLPDYVSLEGVEGPEKTKLYCTVSSGTISTIDLGLCNNLKGLRITGENCRYAVHDDYGANDDGNVRIIENCIIEAINCSYRYAYGAGCRSGQRYTYKNTTFIGNNYEDAAYLMHSNTDFNSPVILEFFNCKFQSLNGHPERGFTLRALSNVQILNKCYINNSYCTGYEFVTSNYGIVDWVVEGSGNNKNAPVSSDNENFALAFYDGN